MTFRPDSPTSSPSEIFLSISAGCSPSSVVQLMNATISLAKFENYLDAQPTREQKVKILRFVADLIDGGEL